ncbi:MAG: flagellar basal body-associated FliL family protein [Defluviitaleaceae bacterium]|nr:flagellar basal body-associated FliL family protein [Defluviitaleaceae bacterium]MCL2836312.1 flagellar basal body-associated FliL family protein [Defluviitaleaceae bacterium]
MRRFGKNNIHGTVIIILTVLLITAGSIYWALNMITPDETSPTRIIRSQILRQDMRDATGRIRPVEAQVAFEVEREGGGGISQEQLERAIQATLSRLDYEEIRALDGMDYIRSELMQTLRADPGINAEAVEAIYITGFASDFSLPAEPMPTNDDPRNQAFDRLFGNWR